MIVTIDMVNSRIAQLEGALSDAQEKAFEVSGALKEARLIREYVLKVEKKPQKKIIQPVEAKQ